jgi:hypothetical protein
MIANLFTKFGWSRDDLKWTVGIVIAAVVALATLSEDMVKTLGLPLAVLHWLPWCRLIAFVVGVVSGTMKTSNLFARGQVPSDAGSIDVNKRVGVGAVLLASALCGSVLVAGCAGLRKPTDPAAVARQIAQKTNPVEHAIVPLQDLEIQAERAALVLAPDAAARAVILKAHITIQTDIKKLSAQVRHVAEVAAGLSTDTLPLGQLIQQLTAAVQPIATEIEMQFGVSASTRTAIGAAATVITAAIATIATS